MRDLIRREDAINVLVNLTCYGIEEMRNLCESSVADSEGWLGGIRDAVDEIEALPSAEQERKTGKWLHKPNEYDDDTYECSQCGEPWTLIEGTPKDNNMNYCPNCGSRLIWGEEE